MDKTINCEKEIVENGYESFFLPQGYYTCYPDKFMKSEEYENLKKTYPDLKVHDWNEVKLIGKGSRLIKATQSDLDHYEKMHAKDYELLDNINI
jgi:hypothetical protein